MTVTLVEKVTALERFKKTMVNLSFTVSLTASGQARVKFKKKIVIAECPDKDSAILLSQDLNVVVRNTQERIDQLLLHLALRCEQLNVFSNNTDNGISLPMFSKDADDAQITGLGGETAGRTIHPDIEDTAGEELPQGLFNRTGSGGFDVQHGSTGTGNGISLP